MKTKTVAFILSLLVSPNQVVSRQDPWSNPNDDSSHRYRINSPKTRYIGGENNGSNKVNLLIKYKPSALRRVRSSFLDSSTRLNHLASSLSNVSSRHQIASVEIDEDEKEAVMLELMMQDDVEFVEEDFKVYAMPYQRTHRVYQESNLRRTLMQESQQIGVDMVQAPQIWKAVAEQPERYNHTSIKVCIIDTGYDFGHEDLPTDDITVTETIYGSALKDGDGHGTHCAGVIGAIGFNNRGVVGVNPDPEKFSFHISKALNAKGVGTASSLIQGIEGCISSGSKIISMSIGGGPNSKIFRDIYEKAYNQGVLVIAAAGNDGTSDHDYPASFPHVVSVGSVNEAGDGRADYSNFNDQIEIMAPGVDVMSTAPNDSYQTLSGTSMSTPYVAGVAALVWSYFPECSNNQIRNVLALTSKRLSPDGSCDKHTGFGLIQAKNAFNVLDRWGCHVAGDDPLPLSRGGFGGCAQALPEFRTELTQTSPTEIPTPKPTMKSFNGDLNLGNVTLCEKLHLDLFTDKMGMETSWCLVRLGDNDTQEEVKSGPPSNMNYAPETQYHVAASDCLSTGTYEFTIYDMFGDGISDPGYYTISLNGQTLASNSNFGSSETTSFTIDTDYLSMQDESRPVATWRTLFDEHFEDGFGSFVRVGDEITHKTSLFGRRGVAFIQVVTPNSQPSLTTNEIEMDEAYSTFEVELSYRTANMDDGQQFCLEYSTFSNSTLSENMTAWSRAGTTNWSRAACWMSGFHFENRMWNDHVSGLFQVQDDIDSLRIRLILADGNYMDRLFIDRVTISGML